MESSLRSGQDKRVLQVKEGTPAETRAIKAERRRLALGMPILTMELIKNQTVDNLVIVTFATWQSYDFVLNWAAHMRSTNVSNFLVGESFSQLHQ